MLLDTGIKTLTNEEEEEEEVGAGSESYDISILKKQTFIQ
jgi:hypothetical protein